MAGRDVETRNQSERGNLNTNVNSKPKFQGKKKQTQVYQGRVATTECVTQFPGSLNFLSAWRESPVDLKGLKWVEMNGRPMGRVGGGP